MKVLAGPGDLQLAMIARHGWRVWHRLERGRKKKKRKLLTEFGAMCTIQVSMTYFTDRKLYRTGKSTAAPSYM